MATFDPGAQDALDVSGEVATALARHTRSLDDRLTLLQIRMVYAALAFGVASFFFALVYLQLINEHGLWMSKGLHQPTLLVGLFEMGLIQAAGLVYLWGQWAGLYRRNFRVLQIALLIAGILTLVSIGFHIYELHHPGFGGHPISATLGFGVHSGYVSVFIVMESVLTVLLIPTAIVLFGLANRAGKGLFERSGVAVEAFGEFYGFMAAVALLAFLGLYVQPFFPIR